MARKKAFTDEQIIKAVSVLRGQGKNINGTNLRLEVGSGRPSSLFSSFQDLVLKGAIKETIVAISVTDEPEVVESKPLPPEIESSLQLVLADVEQMVRHCNDNAHDINEKRVANEINNARKATEVAENRLHSLSDELTATLEILGGLEEQNAELEEELALLRGNQSELDNKVRQLTKDNLDLTTQNTAMSQAAQIATSEIIKLGLEGKAFEKAYNDTVILNLKLVADDKLLTVDLRVCESRCEDQSAAIIKLEDHSALTSEKLNAALVDIKLKDKDLEQNQVDINNLSGEVETCKAEVVEQAAKMVIMNANIKLKEGEIIKLTHKK